MGNQENGYGSEIGDPAAPDIFEKQDVRERMADNVRRFMEGDAKGLALASSLCERMGI
jgi:hypothetical protein